MSLEPSVSTAKELGTTPVPLFIRFFIFCILSQVHISATMGHHTDLQK